MVVTLMIIVIFLVIKLIVIYQLNITITNIFIHIAVINFIIMIKTSPCHILLSPLFAVCLGTTG